jgi:antitoxin YefM
MGKEESYSYAREHLAELWDRVTSDREPIVLTRRDHEDVALIPASELSSLLETVHLLRSPANAKRLMEAFARADAGEGEITTVEALRKEFGVER